MSIPTMLPSGRKGLCAVPAAILLIAFLVPDKAVVEGARLLLQGGRPGAVEEISTTPEYAAPSKPDVSSGYPDTASPGSRICEAAFPQLVELSQVAAESSAMAQAISACRWGNRPNNVAAPASLEGNCIVDFDSKVYSLTFELFSVCTFDYEKYNITTLISVTNFGAAKVVLSLEAVKTFSTSQTSVPYTASQSSPPPGSSETVKTFDWESRWNLLLSNWIPTWTQPPAAPPCDGFNCNKPGYSSDAEKSDEEDEDMEKSSQSDSDSNWWTSRKSASDSDSNGEITKPDWAYDNPVDKFKPMPKSNPEMEPEDNEVEAADEKEEKDGNDDEVDAVGQISGRRGGLGFEPEAIEENAEEEEEEAVEDPMEEPEGIEEEENVQEEVDAAQDDEGDEEEEEEEDDEEEEEDDEDDEDDEEDEEDDEDEEEDDEDDEDEEEDDEDEEEDDEDEEEDDEDEEEDDEDDEDVEEDDEDEDAEMEDEEEKDADQDDEDDEEEEEEEDQEDEDEEDEEDEEEMNVDQDEEEEEEVEEEEEEEEDMNDEDADKEADEAVEEVEEEGKK